MKVEFLKAMSDGTWTSELMDIPTGTIPDKFTRGSAKWNRHAVNFAENNLTGLDIAHIYVLNANPESEE